METKKTTELVVNLDSIDKVKDFVNLTTACEFTIDVYGQNRRHCVDAKSIMGIFSLNLSRPVTISVPRIKDTESDIVPATDVQIKELFDKIKNL